METWTEKKLTIIEAAITLFGRQGFDKTSTKAVAKQAGIGTGTLFKHFDSKEELILQAYRRTKYEMMAAAKEGVVATKGFEPLLRVLWCNMLSWCRRHPDKYQFTQQIVNSRYIDPVLEAVVEKEMLFFKVAAQAAKDNQQIVDVSLELIQQVIWSFLNLAIRIDASPEVGSEQSIYQLMLNSLNIRNVQEN